MGGALCQVIAQAAQGLSAGLLGRSHPLAVFVKPSHGDETVRLAGRWPPALGYEALAHEAGDEPVAQEVERPGAMFAIKQGAQAE